MFFQCLPLPNSVLGKNKGLVLRNTWGGTTLSHPSDRRQQTNNASPPKPQTQKKTVTVAHAQIAAPDEAEGPRGMLDASMGHMAGITLIYLGVGLNIWG